MWDGYFCLLINNCGLHLEDFGKFRCLGNGGHLSLDRMFWGVLEKVEVIKIPSSLFYMFTIYKLWIFFRTRRLLFFEYSYLNVNELIVLIGKKKQTKYSIIHGSNP